MVQRAGKVEAEVISCLSQGRQWSVCRITGVTRRKDFREHVPMPFARNDIEPDAENVRVLAVMFLRGRICQQAVLRIPAELVHCLRSPLRRAAVESSPVPIA